MTIPHLEVCTICKQIVLDPKLHYGKYYCASCDPYRKCPECLAMVINTELNVTTKLCTNCLAKAKECCSCKKLKPLSSYYKQKTSPDGYRNDCKACACATSKKSTKVVSKTLNHSLAIRLTALEALVKQQQIDLVELKQLLSSVDL